MVIGIGSSLEEVERANGRPFRLLPFGDEDGGLVTPIAWQGGRLSQLGTGCALYLQFKLGTIYAASGATAEPAPMELQSNSDRVRYARPMVARAELYLLPEVGEERVRRLQKLLE